MAKRRKQPRQPAYRECIPRGAKFLAGYSDGLAVAFSMSCPACAAELFRVIEQSDTVLVPLPPDKPN